MIDASLLYTRVISTAATHLPAALPFRMSKRPVSLSDRQDQSKKQMGNLKSKDYDSDQESEFPKELEDFGYKFNEMGKLRNIETGEGFLFNVRDGNRAYNQAHYEALGEAIGVWIESELVSRFGLVRHEIPGDSDVHDTDNVRSEQDEPRAKSRIYMSPDALTSSAPLLLLIQGSGVVRPGQWARSVIINESLDLGSMFPYIQRAQELGWNIVVFNPNENEVELREEGGAGPFDFDKGEGKSRKRVKRPRRVFIPGSESPEDHCIYVWRNYVKPSQAADILVVAHSYGGYSTTVMATEMSEFRQRVRAVALTDSVHSASNVLGMRVVEKWFKRHVVNWIKSSRPVGDLELEADRYYQCSCRSAGHPQHEYTSGTAFESVFEFLQDRLDNAKEERGTERDLEAAEDAEAVFLERNGENAEDYGDEEMESGIPWNNKTGEVEESITLNKTEMEEATEEATTLNKAAEERDEETASNKMVEEVTTLNKTEEEGDEKTVLNKTAEELEEGTTLNKRVEEAVATMEAEEKDVGANKMDISFDKD